MPGSPEDTSIAGNVTAQRLERMKERGSRSSATLARLSAQGEHDSTQGLERAQRMLREVGTARQRLRDEKGREQVERWKSGSTPSAAQPRGGAVEASPIRPRKTSSRRPVQGQIKV